MIDLLLPPRCLACAVVGAEPLCADCTDLLEPDGEGHRLAEGIVAIAAFAYADPLAAAIKRVKTDALRRGGVALAGLLQPLLPVRTPRTWVPAPPGRRRHRGIDLPELLAGPAAIPLLRATRRRPDQPDLTAADRRAAAIGAYAALGSVPPAVVVVDDVRATGATLLAAATALREGGARRVLAVSVAASAGSPSAARQVVQATQAIQAALGPARAADRGPGSAAASGRWS
ncbi:hypothetical protein BH23ACT9_BH23ACT9_23300 [soil metagenome]